MTDFTPADMAAVMRGNNDGFDGGSWWIVLVIILMWGRGGWGGNGIDGNPVTEADLCSANSFNELKSQVGRLSDMGQQQAMQTWNGMSNMGYEIQNLVNGLSRQVSECCCTTQRAIDGVNYNIAEQACGIKEAIHREGEMTRGLIQENKIEALQQKLTQMEMQNMIGQATCGMIRMPSQFTYPVPFPWPTPPASTTTTTTA